MDSATSTLWAFLFLIKGVSGCCCFFFFFLLLPYFIEIPVFSVSIVDPDQTPQSAASDLGLHSLHMSLLGVTRH